MLKKIMFAVLCAFFFSGCYFSIEPIFTEKDIISDDAIIGSFSRTESKEVWSFSKVEKENKYILTYIDNDTVASPFKVTLVKIGKYKYLDMLADNKSIENKNGTFRSMFLGCHHFIKYSLENDKLAFMPYDITWLEKKIKNKELNLRYFIRDGGYYFSDSTQDLQKTIIALEDTREAFNKETITVEKIK